MQKFNRQYLRFLSYIFVAILVFYSGCKKEVKRSTLFTQIFTSEEGIFHGVNLGQKIESVLEKEETKPKHDDQWGYMFEYSLGGKKKYFLEYVCKNPKMRTVDAIVLNVYLEEKGEASKLFTEVEMYLRKKYGVADGSLGNLEWNNEEMNLTAALRMLDDKKSFSLNYVPMQTL